MPVPAEFEPHYKKSGITDPWEPIYSRVLDDRVQIGILAGEQHTNSRGFVHGGLLTSLADNAMGLSCAVQYAEPRNILTMSLNIDFVSVAKVGQWILFDTEFSKIGGSTCFAQCFVTGDEKVVARASGVFKS